MRDIYDSLAYNLPQMSWSESYDMYGERKQRYSTDLSSYTNYNKFKAQCKLCTEFTEIFTDSNNAVRMHFLHCAVEHGYVYAIDETLPVTIKDVALQSSIITAQDFNLPLPGYDDHKRCIKKAHLDGAVYCAAHEDNYTINIADQKIWMGWY